MSGRTKLRKDIEGLLQDVFPRSRSRLTFYEHHPQHFGNEIVEFEFDEFFLFVFKDRGEVFADLAPRDAPDSRVPLPDLLEAAGISRKEDFTGSNLPSVEKQIELLGRHLPEILARLKRPR